MRRILLAAVCLLAGCLSRPRLDQQTYIFAPPSLSTPAPKTGQGRRVLGLRSLVVAPPFDGRAFVYRTGEFAYKRDPYAGFMVSPAEGLAAPVCAWWRAAGGFLDVVDSGGALKPDTVVEVHVGQLYGDFRPSETPAAVLVIRFAFFDAPNGVPEKPIVQREYIRRVPLKARTADALIEGWNNALAQSLDSALRDFGRIDPGVPNPWPNRELNRP